VEKEGKRRGKGGVNRRKRVQKEGKRRLKGEVLIEERRVRGFRSSKIFFVLFTASKRSIKLMKILCLKKDFINPQHKGYNLV